MTKTALELLLYMSNSEAIIDWLETENVKTKQQALDKLKPLVESNIRDVFMIRGGTLAGTTNCVQKVIEHFNDED